LEGNYLHVAGKIRSYKINLGSGNILMEPNDHYLCIVQDSDPKVEKQIWLPFEGGDHILMLILSKAFLMADDDKITDKQILISNEHASASDEATNRKGDFMVRATVFYVTVAPGEKVLEKCRLNVIEGYRVYLIVPSERLGIIQSQVQDIFDGKVHLVSIENFVSQNVDEIGEFGDKGITQEIISLLALYNQRVDLAETDKSLMIEIPNNLTKLVGG